MDYGQNLYDVLLVLHILTVVVGFGTVVLNGLYGASIRAAKGPGALAIAQANYRVSHAAQYAIYAVPLFGILLVLRDDAHEWGDLWVWLSMVLYVVGIGVSHGLLQPAVKRMLVLLEEMAASGPPSGGPPPQAAEMGALGKRLGMASTFLNLLLVVLIALMVFKPA